MMKSPAWHRGWRKAARSLAQLIVAGGLTAAVNQIADGLAPNAKVYVLAGWAVLIALLQNTLETSGTIPTLLPTPGLVPSVGTVSGRTVGTVETTIDTVGDTVGDVAGTVTDTAGELMGEVTGAAGVEDDEGDERGD